MKQFVHDLKFGLFSAVIWLVTQLAVMAFLRKASIVTEHNASTTLLIVVVLSLVCFPLSALLTNILKPQTPTYKWPVSFFTSFLCYEIAVFLSALCAANGIEPFVWLGGEGVMVAIITIATPFQLLSIFISITALMLIFKVQYPHFRTTTDLKALTIGFAILLPLGMLPYLLSNMPSEENLTFTAHQQFQIMQEKGQLRCTAPASPEYGDLAIALAIDLYWLGKKTEALNELNFAATKSPSFENKAKVYMQLGHQCRLDDKFHDAARYYELSLDSLNRLQKVPTSQVAEALYFLGRAYALFDPHRSVEAINKAIAMQSDDVVSQQKMLASAGSELKYAGAYSEALCLYRQVRLQPTIYKGSSDIQHSCLEGIALCLYKMGKHNESLPYFEESIATASEDCRKYPGNDHLECLRIYKLLTTGEDSKPARALF